MLYFNRFRRVLLALALLMLAAVGTAAADADASVTNGVYRIHTGGSTWGQVLDVTNASPNANTRVQQWDPLNNSNQSWRVTQMGTDANGPYYRLVPPHAQAMCLG